MNLKGLTLVAPRRRWLKRQLRELAERGVTVSPDPFHNAEGVAQEQYVRYWVDYAGRKLVALVSVSAAFGISLDIWAPVGTAPLRTITTLYWRASFSERKIDELASFALGLLDDQGGPL